MAFKVVKKLPSIEWPVVVQIPVSGGKTDDEEFTATFKLLSDDEYKKAATNAKDDAEFIGKILIGWSGIEDENGEPYPFNKANLRAFVKVPYQRIAITSAYSQAISGVAAKN